MAYANVAAGPQQLGGSSPSLPAQQQVALMAANLNPCLGARILVARRGGLAIMVREAATLQRIHRIPDPRQVRDFESEVLDLIEPTNVHLVQTTVHIEPRDDRLVVCP